MFTGMDFDTIAVIIALVFILISLYTELIGVAFTFIIATTFLGLCGVITPKEILGGFANEQIVIVLMLLLIGDIIRQTSVIEKLFRKIFSGSSGYKTFMIKMMAVVAPLSAFLNNTPLVAIMMPYVHSWCTEHNVSPSKLLIPLSYSAILGGCITLIGTSTNLIVNGLLETQTIIPGLRELEMFDFFWVGFPMMLIGFLYLVIFSDRLLPDRSNAISSFSKYNRDYLIQAITTEDSPLIGHFFNDKNLKKLYGLYLVEILREGVRIKATSKNSYVKSGDILTFAGDTPTIANLITKHKTGLEFPNVESFENRSYSEVLEIVISPNSRLIGKSVIDANFRGKYDSAVIAIHRNGERISGKISNIKLKAGDALIIYAGDNFGELSQGSHNFLVISKVKENIKVPEYKDWLLLGGLALAILLSSVKIVPLFTSLTVLLIIISIFNIYSPKDISKSLDYNLGVVIALSLSLGIAMVKTGVAESIADFIISIFLPYGNVALIAGIYLITTILANFITNKAAVAILFPISLSLAAQLQLPPMPFILVVAFASAANFMTPIGYQTNLMVYGPGGYSFKDFFKIGFPLTIIYMVVTVAILSFMYL